MDAEIVENTLEAPIEAVLDRPLFCFLAQRSGDGPRVSPLWFLREAGAVWMIAQHRGRSYPDRVRRDPHSALAVVDFDPGTGRVEHVGMRGRATLEPYDADRAGRLLERYLGADRGAWPDRFRDLEAADYGFVRFEPETVVARDLSYPAPGGVDG